MEFANNWFLSRLNAQMVSTLTRSQAVNPVKHHAELASQLRSASAAMWKDTDQIHSEIAELFVEMGSLLETKHATPA